MTRRSHAALRWAAFILIICFFVQLFAYGIRHSFPVFFPFILNEYQWARGDTALMFSIHLFVYGISAPVAGMLLARFPAKLLLLSGISILTIATAACSYATELWHFYLLFGVLAPIGLACTGSPILSPTIVNWFANRRGTALALAQIGGGLSFLFVFLMEFVIEGTGWRFTYVVMGIIVSGVLLPLILVGYFFHPKDRGLEPVRIRNSDSRPDNLSSDSPRLTIDSVQWARRSALFSRELWMLFFSIMFFWGTGSYLVLAHQVKHIIEIGHSPSIAASTTAIFGVFMVIGQGGALISDWIGREFTVLLASVLASAGVLLFIFLEFHHGLTLLYVFAALFGLGSGLFAVCIFAGTADIFAGRHFGLFNGIVLSGLGFGGALGPWLGGFLYDISGTYFFSFLFALSSFSISFIAFYLAGPRRYVARGFG